MERMNCREMVEFLKEMEKKQDFLKEEHKRLKNSIETMEEAIRRNTFSKRMDDIGTISGLFSADKVLRILLNSERDIEEETKRMVMRMMDIYTEEEKIEYVRRCLMKMDMQDQFLLREAYINDVMVEHLVLKMNMSKSNLYRLLQRAVERLVKTYNANCGETQSGKAQRLFREVSPFMTEGGLP